MFKNLKSLHLYAEPPFYDHRTDLYNVGWHFWYDTQLREKSYSTLLENLPLIAPTLEVLELPRGFWTLPNMLPRSGVIASTDAFKESDVYVGEATDFRAFTALKHLIISKAAIMHKRTDKETTANPAETLPRSVRRITVYGADKELYTWLGYILENQHPRLPWLAEIEFLEGEPRYPRPCMERLEQLKVHDADIWNKLVASGIKLTISS
ncbi:hypothetical protein K504DRAFT_457648 [Pleomassaria siparia CBS 279.74]|uniref:Uncharacterized protein n=1 Tax=Pleomassaria siparia CBS 279.74 TaxID=1314801 RepID=A0A6G1KT37_9PLEO|nr:hypothetical protein K504DRAFT_457648 [Pleomassaria siparia CBS 279.74]